MLTVSGVNKLCWFFFFKQKTAYEMRISDWSSDVCSSDLVAFDPTTSERTFRLALYENPAVMLIPDLVRRLQSTGPNIRIAVVAPDRERKIGRASCRERVCQYV